MEPAAYEIWLLRLAYLVYVVLDGWLYRLLGWQSAMGPVFGACAAFYLVSLMATFFLTPAELPPVFKKSQRVILFVNALVSLSPLLFYPPRSLHLAGPVHGLVCALGLVGYNVLSRQIRFHGSQAAVEGLKDHPDHS